MLKVQAASGVIGGPSPAIQSGLRNCSFLLRCVSGLGVLTDTGFIVGDECTMCLKDINYYLKKDAERDAFDVALLLGEFKTVQKALLPLAWACRTEEKTLLHIARIIFRLATPVSATEPKGVERTKYLLELKRAFLEPRVMSTFTAMIEEPIMKNDGRTDSDKLKIDLVLHLVLNLLKIPDPKPAVAQGGLAVFAGLHRDFVIMLEKEVVIDTLLFLAQCINRPHNRNWNLTVMELVFHIFRGTKAEDLIVDRKSRVPAARSRTDTEAVEAANQMDEENDPLSKSSRRKQQKSRLSQLTSRHGRFGGTLQLSKTGSSQKAVVSNAFAQTAKMLDPNASRLRTTELSRTISTKMKLKRRREDSSAMSKDELTGESNSAVLTTQLLDCLRACIEKIVNNCYKPLFMSVISDFRRDSANRVLPADQLQYLWLLGYCTQYQRLQLERADKNYLSARDRDAPSSEVILPSIKFDWTASSVFVTLDMWNFAFVIKSCTLYRDERSWVAAEVAVRAFKEMLLAIKIMKESKHGPSRKTGRSVQNAVFYRLRELDVFCSALRTWDFGTHTRRHLVDLVYVMDTILNMAEKMAEEGAVVEARRANKKKKTKDAAQKSNANSAQSRLLKAQGKNWNAEETRALYEGVAQYGGEMRSMMRIVADPTFGLVLSSRTPQNLSARWRLMSDALRVPGTSLEDFISNDAGGDDDDDEEYDNGAGNGYTAAADAERREENEVRRNERELRFLPYLRKYMGNTIVERVLGLLDAEFMGDVEKEDSNEALHGIVATFLKRVRNFEDEYYAKRRFKRGTSRILDEDAYENPVLEPILWHVRLFQVIHRALLRLDSKAALATRAHEMRGTKTLVGILKSTIRSFFDHASDNPLFVCGTRAVEDSH